MKKYIIAVMLVATLSGCDNANKMIEQVKDTANSAVDSIQKHIESVDLSKLNLDQFGDAAGSAKKLTESINQALNVDFGNIDAVAKAKEHIANAYSCLVDVSSESTAEKLMNKISASLNDKDAESLIEKGIQKAKDGYKCIM